MLICDLLASQDDGFLWQSLQEENGIVYEVNGHVDYYQEFGFLSCGAPFMLEDLKAGFSIIMKQVERIKKADYSETILKKFQKRCIQADKRRWNHNFDRFVWVMGDIIDRGRTYELEEWLSFYEGLDKNYLAEVANKYLDNQRLQISILASKDNKVDLSFFEHYA
jgi:predicted Zn-dependent peptidase